MVFTKRLREGVRRGRIRCSVRIWQRLHVKVGGRYPMDDGHIVIDSIDTIERSAITDALARESGFADADDLLQTASHGPGQGVYLIRFHYLAPGAWEVPSEEAVRRKKPTTLLQRIHSSRPPAMKPKRSDRRATSTKRHSPRGE